MPKKGAKAAFIELAVAYTGNDCLLWPYHRIWSGYGVIEFRGQRNYRAHRIVCERVHGLPEDARLGVAHSCGNPACVSPAHLRWATQKENLADMDRHGTRAKGTKLPQAKLTAADIPRIRELAKDGETHPQIARRYGVTREAIREIIHGRSWGWL